MESSASSTDALVPFSIADFGGASLEFPTSDEFLTHLRTKARALGFELKTHGSSHYDANHVIVHRVFRCSFACESRGAKRTRLCNCPFKIAVHFDEDAKLWKLHLRGTFLSHNTHPMSTAVAKYTRGVRDISPDVRSFIQSFRDENVPRSAVSALAAGRYPDEEILPIAVGSLWKQRNSLPMKKLIEVLGDSTSFRSVISRNEDGFLKSMAWICVRALDTLKSHCRVILMDATYRTNQYEMPFVLFTGCDETYRTFIFGAALLDAEQTEDYVWALNSLKSLLPDWFSERLQCIVTDLDFSEERAISSVFPSVHHILCIFHMFQNVTKNLSAKLGEKFAEFLTAFRKIVYGHDEAACLSELESLKAKYPSSRAYVEFLGRRKHKWCAAWTGRISHLGNRTTGRAESCNAQMKQCLRRAGQLWALVKLTDSAVRKYLRVHENAIARHLCTKRTSFKDPIEESVVRLFTPKVASFVLREIRSRCEPASRRRSRARRGRQESPRPAECSRNEVGVYVCTCPFYSTMLLPCRHVRQLLLRSGSVLTESEIDEQWRAGTAVSGETGECSTVVDALTIQDEEGETEAFDAHSNIEDESDVDCRRRLFKAFEKAVGRGSDRNRMERLLQYIVSFPIETEAAGAGSVSTTISDSVDMPAAESAAEGSRLEGEDAVHEAEGRAIHDGIATSEIAIPVVAPDDDISAEAVVLREPRQAKHKGRPKRARQKSALEKRPRGRTTRSRCDHEGAAVPKKRRNCTKCGQEGHYAKTCTENASKG
jgi:zinc finger SWIM domain-containing protein 3